MKTVTHAPTASARAYQLADAIGDMALRLAEAERKGAYVLLHDDVERARWARASHRRLRALMRLTRALRDQRP